MKRLSLYLFLLLFTLQTPSRAEDIRDFQIEGMSIGDSALDYFSENKIIKQKKDYYTNKKYTDSEIFFESNSKYYSIHVIYKTSDKRYTIEGLSATILYKNNINKCYQKLDEIDLEVADLFKNTKKTNKKTSKHDSDKTGKSTVTDILYDFKNGDRILLACYNWSKKKKYLDHLRISLRTKEFENFLNYEAYN